MEDKTFELLTKMYSDFLEFRAETNSKFNSIEKKLDSVEGHVLRIGNKQMMIKQLYMMDITRHLKILMK